MNADDYDHRKLQKIRKEKFTQAEIAGRLECTTETISRAERGISASFQLLKEITSHCGISIKEIIRDNIALN